MALNKQKVIRSAEKLVKRGRIEAAINEYRKVLRKFPNDTSTLNRVGDLYTRLNRNDEAIDLFKRTAEHFGGEGFYVKAIAIYKKIIRLDPTKIEIYEELADLYSQQGLTSEARAQYEVVADYFHAKKDTSGAIAIYRKMADLEPDNPSIRLRLAELFQEQQQLSEAMSQYRAIASLMLAHGRAEKAAQVCLKALEIDSSDLDFIAGSVQEIRDSGHATEAEMVLRAAVALNPEAANLEEQLEEEIAESPEEEVAEPEEGAAGTAEEEPTDEGQVVVLDADEVVEVLDGAEQREPTAEPSPVDTAVSEAAAAEIEGVEFEIDLDEAVPPLETPAVEVEEIVAAESAPVEAEAEAEVSPALDELLSEAAVLSKYGLNEKAAERLEEALEIAPRRLEILADLIGLHLTSGHRERVVELANRMAALADDLGSPQTFDKLRQELVEKGFMVEEGRVALQEVEAEVEPAEIEAEEPPVALEEPPAVAEEPPAAPEEPPAVAEEPPAAPQPFAPEEVTLSSEQIAATLDEVKATLDQLRAQAGVAHLPPTKLPGPAPPDAVAPPEAGPAEEQEEVAAGEPAAAEEAPAVTEEAPAVAEEAPAAGPLPEEPVTASEDAPFAGPEVPEKPPPDVSWLETPEARAAGADQAAEALFSDEEEFFDLASELEEELLQEETLLDQELHQPETEQSLEEIVEGFKEGMAETLSAEDYDTHYNLGVAYREMGLLDEAIGEFQLAAKDPRYLVECCSMLATCFREKGFPELAVKWYQRALDSPNVTEDETLGLIYELADLHAAMGDTDAARERFVEIYGINSNYRDVVARLEELGHS